MNQTHASHADPLRRYLLGESSTQERGAVERRLMTDPEYLEATVLAEDELIDQYARGELDVEEKEKFETLFLQVPERREKVAFAQAFHRHLAQQPPAPPVRAWPPFWRNAAMASLAAALVLLVILTGFLYRETILVRRQLAGSELQRTVAEKTERAASEQLIEQQKRNADLQQQLATLRGSLPAFSPQIVAVKLSSGWSRGSASMPGAYLSPSSKRLRLDLTLGKDQPRYVRYHIQVQTVEGTPVWAGNGVAPGPNAGTRSVSVTAPASKFLAGDYLVVLNGISPDQKPEEVATYYFRVTRK